jgi:Raf kinase inhibitor-like YbhB/YbcL family protein
MKHRLFLQTMSTLAWAWIGLAAACSRPDNARRAGNSDSATGAASDTAQAGTAARASSDTGASQSTALALTSPAFKNNGAIPAKFTCDGANHSPPLAWSGAPTKTASYALIVEDPDAPGGTFVHWVIYDIPAATTSLPEGVQRGESVSQLGGARQGQSGFKGQPGYGGPCPPQGDHPHRYLFTVFAVGVEQLPVNADTSAAVVGFQLHFNTLDKAELMGLFKH